MTRYLLITASCVGLVSCGAPTPGADIVLSQSAEVQMNALQTCHAQLGISGPLRPHRLDLSDGRVLLTAINGEGTSIADARAINGCARNMILSNNAGATPNAQDIAYDSDPDTWQIVEPSTQPITERTQGSYTACPDGAAPLYGGATYCIGLR